MRLKLRALPWEAIVAALLLACAAASLRSRAKDLFANGRGAYCREETDMHVERGDALLHGVPRPEIARAMPFYSVPNAYLCFRLTPSASAAVRFAVLLAGAALVFALAATLYSGLCGAAAALLYALLARGGGDGERWLYTPTVLLAAYFLVRRAKAPSLAASVCLGAAIGASLLVLSPLFLFPLLLVLYEWSRRRKIGAAQVWDAGATCLAPFLFLIPWAVMNWRLYGRFVVFEDGRADANVVTGALGFVRTMGLGNSRELAAVSAGRSALAWAAAETLRHPLRYLAAVFARLRYAASLHPALVLASLVSIWLARKREDCRQLALLAAYFFAMHCLMPVQESYFVPAWPLLAVLASGLLSWRTAPASENLKRACAAAAGSIFALLLLAQARVLGVVWSYPARAAESGAWERELARDRSDPWLWSEYGMGLLRVGRAKEAEDALARAFLLDPQYDREIRYAWALLMEGGPGARIWENLRPGDIGTLIDLRAHVLWTIYLVLEGRRAEAIDALASASEAARSSGALENSLPQVVADTVAFWPAARRRELVTFFTGAFRPAARRREFIESFVSAAPFRNATRGEILAKTRMDAAKEDLAAGNLRAALKELKSAEKENPGSRSAIEDMILDMAAQAANSGRRPSALGMLELAENNFPLDPERIRRAARIGGNAGDCARAVALLRRLNLSGPRDADLLLNLAAEAARLGRKQAALESLALAEDMRLDPGRTRRLAQGYEDLGDVRGGERVRRRARDDAGSWLDRAEAAAAAGNRASALAAASRAQGLDLVDSEARRLLLIEQGLGEYARALALADLRVRARPGDARWRSDRGVLQALRGEREAAAADLRSALALDPDLVAPYLSLGLLYASSRREKEALDLYDKALLRPRIADDAEASRQIRVEREKLASAVPP